MILPFIGRPVVCECAVRRRKRPRLRPRPAVSKIAAGAAGLPPERQSTDPNRQPPWRLRRPAERRQSCGVSDLRRKSPRFRPGVSGGPMAVQTAAARRMVSHPVSLHYRTSGKAGPAPMAGKCRIPQVGVEIVICHAGSMIWAPSCRPLASINIPKLHE
jgi:hypothetical protein